MVDRLLGHWKLERNENIDEFMKSIGVSYFLRQVGKKITSYEEIQRDGDDWLLHATSTFRSTKLQFRLDVPFNDTTLEGRNVSNVFKVEGGKLVCVHTPFAKDEVPAMYVRQVLEDGRMLETCTCLSNGVVAKRYFVPYQP